MGKNINLYAINRAKDPIFNGLSTLCVIFSIQMSGQCGRIKWVLTKKVNVNRLSMSHLKG